MQVAWNRLTEPNYNTKDVFAAVYISFKLD